MAKTRRLLTVGHSYVVTLNRRLAHEMAQVGKDRWDVTVAAPNYISGDLRPITLETFPDEACRLERVNAYLSQFNHLMFYGSGLRSLLVNAGIGLVEQLQTLRAVLAILIEPRCSFPVRDGSREP